MKKLFVVAVFFLCAAHGAEFVESTKPISRTPDTVSETREIAKGEILKVNKEIAKGVTSKMNKKIGGKCKQNKKNLAKLTKLLNKSLNKSLNELLNKLLKKEKK